MMKKLIICLTALMMLAACSNKADESQNAEENQTPDSEMTTNTGEDQGEWLKQSTIKSNKPMVVDFYATWCGPCKELAPILDKIEENHKGEVIFKRIDVDQEPLMAQEFNVEAIPTLMFITPTGEYQTVMGLQEPELIEAKIATLLERSAK